MAKGHLPRSDVQRAAPLFMLQQNHNLGLRLSYTVPKLPHGMECPVCGSARLPGCPVVCRRCPGQAAGMLCVWVSKSLLGIGCLLSTKQRLQQVAEARWPSEQVDLRGAQRMGAMWVGGGEVMDCRHLT